MKLSSRTSLQAAVVALALAVGPSGELPTEVRLFARGWNTTTKGRFLFDDEAAAAVMAAHASRGVDLPFDLEHQMLEEPGSDPTSRDARGWFQLAVRDGELWAVGIRWTSDGAARLTEKRQRYVSPAFDFDKTTRRVTEVVNAAIVAMPATHKTPALVAASMAGGCMNPELVKKALDALESGDSTSALEILKSLIAAAAGAPPAHDGAAPPAPPPPAQNSDDPPPPPEGEEDEKKIAAAAASRLAKATGKSTVTEALAEIDVWKASHVTLTKREATEAAERATLEGAERKRLCGDLVRLGAELPATIWADADSQKPTTLKPRWVSMSIAELRTHVAEHREARRTRTGGAAGGTVTPPAASGGDAGSKSFTVAGGKVVTLDARELKACTELKCDPAVFASMKAKQTQGAGA